MQLDCRIYAGLALGAFAVSMAAVPAASAATLKVHVDSIKSGGMIPDKYAFCMPAAQEHVRAGGDVSPSISWSKGPKGTQSYAVILNDTDSPKTNRDKMNKEGMTVPSTSERQTFYHWVLVDIPPNVRSLKEGADFDRARCARQDGTGSSRHAWNEHVQHGVRRQRCDEG